MANARFLERIALMTTTANLEKYAITSNALFGRPHAQALSVTTAISRTVANAHHRNVQTTMNAPMAFAKAAGVCSPNVKITSPVQMAISARKEDANQPFPAKGTLSATLTKCVSMENAALLRLRLRSAWITAVVLDESVLKANARTRQQRSRILQVLGAIAVQWVLGGVLLPAVLHLCLRCLELFWVGCVGFGLARTAFVDLAMRSVPFATGS